VQEFLDVLDKVKSGYAANNNGGSR
jgi:hypothetical protein